MTVSTPTSAEAWPSGSRQFPFMRWRGAAFAVTVMLTLGTIVSLFAQGLNLGLDFTGGVLIEARAPTEFDVTAIRDNLAASGVEDASVQLATVRPEPGDPNRWAVLIRAGLESDAGEGQTQAMVEQVRTALGQGITACTPGEARTCIERTETVGPQVSGELLRGGLIAAGLAVAFIALYVWFRFESKFGFAALITTFHDVFIIMGLFSLTQMTFDLTTIAALLTVAGYSVNDTVVVFDRIREMMRKHKRLSLSDRIDEAINATLSRTIVTGCTTLVATLAILFFAGPVLFGFAAAIICGVLVGTYSSIFVAAPLLLYLPGRMPGDADGKA